MSAFRLLAVAACVSGLAWGGAAAALPLDYQPLGDQSAASITQVVGGVTVSAHAFGASPTRRSR